MNCEFIRVINKNITNSTVQKRKANSRFTKEHSQMPIHFWVRDCVSSISAIKSYFRILTWTWSYQPAMGKSAIFWLKSSHFLLQSNRIKFKPDQVDMQFISIKFSFIHEKIKIWRFDSIWQKDKFSTQFYNKEKVTEKKNITNISILFYNEHNKSVHFHLLVY